MSRTLYVGTVGEGLWVSPDCGESFNRKINGMFIEADVRALAVHPGDPRTLFAGTNCGMYRTSDGGESWDLLDTGFGTGWPGSTAETVWSIAISPHNPDLIFAGLCPSAAYRSKDGGSSWQLLNPGFATECGAIVYPRVTCIVPDPVESGTIWAGVEIDGIYRSMDSGDSWEHVGEGLSSQDIHSLAVIPGSPKKVIAATNNDLNVSIDDGQTWKPCGVKALFDWGYCRGIAAKANDPQTLFQGNGNGPPGSAGAIQISRDAGRSWSKAALPFPSNSTIWTFAITAGDPDLIAAASVSGYIYLSSDGGATWRKLAREFGEIRSLALT